MENLKQVVPIQQIPDSSGFWIHCTGGLRATEYDRDKWTFEPFLVDGKPCAKAYLRRSELQNLFTEVGCKPFAMEQFEWRNGYFRSTWVPITGPVDNHLRAPSELWMHIGGRLGDKRINPHFWVQKDVNVEEIAKTFDDHQPEERLSYSIGLSIRNLDISVKNISDFYYNSCINLLRESKFDRKWYSNPSMDAELFANVHSFFVTFGTLRDYLGALISARLKLNSKIDSMARLLQNITKEKVDDDALLGTLHEECMIRESASQTWEAAGWLKESTSLRDRFVHRRPFGQSFYEQGGKLEKLSSNFDAYRYHRPCVDDGLKKDDIFDIIISTYERANKIFQKLAERSGYDFRPLTLTDKDVISVK